MFPRSLPTYLALPAALLLLSACTTPGTPGRPLPKLAAAFPFDLKPKLAPGAQTQEIDRVSVSARLIPTAESRRTYGVDLASKDIQALWLQITNDLPHDIWLLNVFTDQDYFTAEEVAHMFRSNAEQRQKFHDLAIRARLQPGQTYQGHILLPMSEGGRYIQVVLSGSGQVRTFGFPLRTPDGHFDFENLDPLNIYPQGTRTDLALPQLRKQLESLPATATKADGTGTADPLNFVLVGEPKIMMAALSEAGWSFTHRIDWTTIRREISSALTGAPYFNAPVSDLYVFGRPQDLAFQRARSKLSQRNHLRLWLAPYTTAGKSVWIGQVSRDIGIKLTTKSSTFTTHVIDPAVDEARQYVLESILLHGRVRHFGFVRAFEPATRDQPLHNLTGDPYFSDGMRLIVFIPDEPVPLRKVQNLGWDQTPHGPIESQQSRRR